MGQCQTNRSEHDSPRLSCTATAATALTLTATTAAEAQGITESADQIETAQLTTTGQDVQPAATGTGDWTRPAAMTIPKGGYFKREQGRYGPVFPRTPANHGFTVIAKVKPGRENAIREYGKTIEQAIVTRSDRLDARELDHLAPLLRFIGDELSKVRG